MSWLVPSNFLLSFRTLLDYLTDALAHRWFPAFQEQAIVGDQRPVIGCFARPKVLALLFMLRQGFPHAFQRLE